MPSVAALAKVTQDATSAACCRGTALPPILRHWPLMPAPDHPAEVDPRFAARAASRFAAEPRVTAQSSSAAAAGDEPVALLRALLAEARVAALATLHRGDPAVSMVPFALDRSAGALLLHVSALATHTRDMAEHAAVSLLVMAAETPEVPPQARARASLTGAVEFIAPDGAEHAAARAIYLTRFPQAEPIFDLADFSLVRVTPHSARVIGGFAQAASLVGDRLQQALR